MGREFLIQTPIAEVTIHSYNPSTGGLKAWRQESPLATHDFRVSLGYVRPNQKIK